MNLMSGAGYWAFSGATNLGDWSEVIRGWQPHWLWRSSMAIFGGCAVIFVAWIALTALGRIIGDGDDHRVGLRVARLSFLSYLTAALVSSAAALLNPGGPEVRHIVMGAVYPTPLLWMTLWFRTRMFLKHPGPPLVFGRQWPWITVASVVFAVFVFVFGVTISF